MPAANTGRPKVHVHVPYGRFEQYLPALREHRLDIELHLSSFYFDDITPDGIAKLKDSLDWGPSVSIHGPFMDLCPGAIDTKIARASLERYLEAVELAEPLKPEVIVFHSGYEKWKYGEDTTLWRENSIRTWHAVMERAEKTGIKVAVENIIDERPDHLRQLADEMAHPLFGLCLDVGHREIFSTLGVEEWAQGMSPHIFELHLHDNNGVNDDHLPLGEGRIKLDGLLSNLHNLPHMPVCTLEAHSAEDAFKSIEYLKRFFG